MERFALKHITGKLLLGAIVLLLARGIARAASTGCDGAGNCYVRAGATGSGSGADWTNAYTQLPSTLTRGVTYYVGGGSYPSYEASTPDSGTTLITIKAATLANHGTSTGWSNSYATDVNGSGSNQAIFAAELWFASDYWLIDGNQSYTGMGCGNNDATGGYGGGGAGCNFKVDGSHCTSAWCEGIGLCDAASYGWTTCPSNITIKYVDILGMGGPNVDAHFDQGNVHQDSDAWAVLNAGPYTLSHLYIHNSSGCPFFTEFANGVTIDHSFMIGNGNDTNGNHATGYADMGSKNVTISNNAWESIEGSDFIEVLDRGGCSGGQNPSTCTASGWEVYGNIFWYDSGNKLACQTSPCQEGVGDGVIACINGLICPSWQVYQNVFVNIIGYNAGLCEDCTGEGNVKSSWTVYNNLWWNNNNTIVTPQTIVVGAGSAYGCSTCTMTEDYNSALGYQSGAIQGFTGSHDITVQSFSTSPFVGWSSSPANFHLSSEQTDWINGVTLSSPFNVDPDGVTRGSSGNWDRGVFQFVTVISPPTNLTATAH